MSVDLNKRAETATDTLINTMKDLAAKGVDLGEVSAEVELAVDYSGSMSGRYPHEVEDLVERCLALSMSGLDVDKQVPVHFFHHDVFTPIVTTPDQYQGMVRTFQVENPMGGTNYTPFLRQIHRGYDGDNSKPPHLVIVVTDGVPGDEKQVVEFLVSISGDPYFFAFIGLGVNLKFLKKLDTMKGRVLDNVSLTEARTLQGMDDTTFFKTVLDEWLTSWLPAAKAKGIAP